MNLHNYILARDVRPRDVEEARKFIKTIFEGRANNFLEMFDKLGGNEEWNMLIAYNKVLEPTVKNKIHSGLYGCFIGYMKKVDVELLEYIDDELLKESDIKILKNVKLLEGDDAERRIDGGEQFKKIYSDFEKSSFYPEEQ